jgi:predicted nucleic acid-binding protein
MLYLDTSALVKLYVAEEGSPLVLKSLGSFSAMWSSHCGSSSIQRMLSMTV